MRRMPSVTAGTRGGLALTSEVHVEHKPAGHAFAGECRRTTEAEVPAVRGAPW